MSKKNIKIEKTDIPEKDTLLEKFSKYLKISRRTLVTLVMS